MTISEATELIRLPEPHRLPSGRWTDLGCGSGTFTGALASLLPEGSEITAVDSDPSVLKRLAAQQNGVTILPVAADLTRYVKPQQNWDGVLMANALHFVRDQESFLLTLKESMRPGGFFLLVEYDMLKGSRWVPFPLPPQKAGELLTRCGFTGFVPLQRRASLYGPQFLYSAYTHA